MSKPADVTGWPFVTVLEMRRTLNKLVQQGDGGLRVIIGSYMAAVPVNGFEIDRGGHTMRLNTEQPRTTEAAQ